MNYKYGITGNYYYTSLDKKELEAVCLVIGKAKSSIYYNKKYNTWVIRIKSKKHKQKARDNDQGNSEIL